jgi:hypothetical protein
MNSIRHSSKLVMLILVLMISAFGCKSKKKAMEASAAEKARMEQEATARKQQEEEQRRKEAEEKSRREAELKQTMESAPKTRLSQYFESITSASNATSANNSIVEALSLFASPDTPVLIVISEADGQKDYDRPTTIRDYLNYLKDQKKNINTISNLQFDGAGKITEVELKKN